MERKRAKESEKEPLRRLFWSFLKIGAFTFGGGYAMIPVIQREVVMDREWVKEEDFLELLTLAQSAPGPISLNSSVFVGYRLRGFVGALTALLGVVLPSFIIILLIAMYFQNFRDYPWVDAAFKGMRPAVVALILAPLWGMAKGLGWWRLLIAAAVALLIWYFEISPVWFIIAGVVGGVTIVLYNAKKTSPR